MFHDTFFGLWTYLAFNHNSVIITLIWLQTSIIHMHVTIIRGSRSLSNTALRKLAFHFLSNWMGYDRGKSSTFYFEPNGNPFGSKSKGKLFPWSYPIQFERKWNTSFLSAVDFERTEIVILVKIAVELCLNTLHNFE